MADWRVDLLAALRAPVTPANLRFLGSWQAREGGHTANNATFNWLNSTSGSGYPRINSVGVRAYPDYQTGIRYTASTIENGRYPNIVAGLRRGNPYTSSVVRDLSVWVSGSPTGGEGYAESILQMGTGQVLRPSATDDSNVGEEPKPTLGCAGMALAAIALSTAFLAGTLGGLPGLLPFGRCGVFW